MHGLHDLKITGTTNRFNLTLDGVKVKGVVSASFSASVGQAPTLKLELFIGEYDLDVQTLDILEEKKDGK